MRDRFIPRSREDGRSTRRPYIGFGIRAGTGARPYDGIGYTCMKGWTSWRAKTPWVT
jgi:hypothetical protein